MTARLPALRARDVVRALERAGFVVSRTSGSHCRLIHAETPARAVTIAIHGGRDIKAGTLHAIIRQAGLSVEEFLALL
jgi:predicted RNA binding protein YcfA (HicA-like mRNA interferase family)